MLGDDEKEQTMWEVRNENWEEDEEENTEW